MGREDEEHKQMKNSKMESLEERLINLAMVFKKNERVSNKEHVIYYDIIQYIKNRNYSPEYLREMNDKEFITLEHDIYYSLSQKYCKN